MKRRWIASGLTVLGVVVIIGAGIAGPALSGPKKQLLMGSTQMVSSYYPPSVALARLINENVPQGQVTVVESGATYDNLERTRVGEFQFSMPSAYSGILESYHGYGRFKGRPDKSLRMLFVEACSPIYAVVRADSGITDISGLHGKSFYAGPTGHISTIMVEKALEDSGIRPKYFIGGFSDAVTAAKDNRIVGFAKFAAGTQLDASMIDLKESGPIRVLSFTEKQVDYMVREFPGNEKMIVPKGQIRGVPEAGPILTPNSCVTCWTTSSLPEDIAYGIVKAASEHWKDIIATLAIAKDIDPVKTSLTHLSTTSKVVPLHTGAIKYFKERGGAIPGNLIPPEYKK